MSSKSKRKNGEKCFQNSISKKGNIRFIIMDKGPQSQIDEIEMQIRTGAMHPIQQTALFSD